MAAWERNDENWLSGECRERAVEVMYAGGSLFTCVFFGVEVGYG